MGTATDNIDTEGRDGGVAGGEGGGVACCKCGGGDGVRCVCEFWGWGDRGLGVAMEYFPLDGF